MTVPSFNIAPGESSESLAIKRRLALELLKGGMDTSPVRHWTQGAARAMQAALGGYEIYRADKDDKDETTKGNAIYERWLNSGQQTPAATPAVSPAPASTPPATYQAGTANARVADAFSALSPAPPSRSGDAIAGIESGGRYDALGPVIKTGVLAGDRGHGKHQVMGTNIGPWSEAALGRRLTAAEFLADPKAQEAVFAHRFGQYEQKYGPEGAARAWFAGEKGMNNLNARDQLGTTVGGYGKRVAQALGQPSPQQASAPQPAQVAQTSAPASAAQAPAIDDQKKQLLIQMLGNRKTAATAKAIIGAQIQQQFKPSEYDFKERPDGSIVAIDKKNPKNMQVINPGDPQALIDHAAKKKGAEVTAEELAKRAVAQPDKDKQAKATADIVTTDIDRSIKGIDGSVVPATGFVGNLASKVPGTAAHDVSKLLDTIKANTGFDALAKMRAASPTGGALGSITEQELKLLQATVGNLEQSQTADQLKDNLRRVKNAYLDVVHGPGKGPDREPLTFSQPKGGATDIDALVKKYGG